MSRPASLIGVPGSAWAKAPAPDQRVAARHPSPSSRAATGYAPPCPAAAARAVRKLVYVSSSLVAALLAFCRDARLGATDALVYSRRSGGTPMARQHAWRLVTCSAAAAGVRVVGRDGRLRPATSLDFRHGAAGHRLRAGLPLSEVQAQLGHARIDTTTVYPRLTNAERRRYAGRVAW